MGNTTSIYVSDDQCWIDMHCVLHYLHPNLLSPQNRRQQILFSFALVELPVWGISTPSDRDTMVHEGGNFTDKESERLLRNSA